MIKKLSLLFLVSVFMISCEDNSISENTIEGTWNVTEIIGGFAQSKNYEEGTFTWTFNLETKTVTIINVSQPANPSITPSFTNDQGGVYSFTIENENNIDYLVVGDRKGTIALNGNNLTVDYGIAFDDIAYVFER